MLKKKKAFSSLHLLLRHCFCSYDANHMVQPDNVSPTVAAHAPPATRHTCYLSSCVCRRFGARDRGPPSLPLSCLLFPSQDLRTQCLADYLKQSCEAWQQISCAREREKTSRAGWPTWSWIEFSNLSGSATGWASHIPDLSAVNGGFLKGFAPTAPCLPTRLRMVSPFRQC